MSCRCVTLQRGEPSHAPLTPAGGEGQRTTQGHDIWCHRFVFMAIFLLKQISSLVECASSLMASGVQRRRKKDPFSEIIFYLWIWLSYTFRFLGFVFPATTSQLTVGNPVVPDGVYRYSSCCTKLMAHLSLTLSPASPPHNFCLTLLCLISTLPWPLTLRSICCHALVVTFLPSATLPLSDTVCGLRRDKTQALLLDKWKELCLLLFILYKYIQTCTCPECCLSTLSPYFLTCFVQLPLTV